MTRNSCLSYSLTYTGEIQKNIAENKFSVIAPSVD